MTLIEAPSDLAVARQLLAEEIEALEREGDAIERGLETVRAVCDGGNPPSARLSEAEARLEAALDVVARQLAGLRHAIACLDQTAAGRNTPPDAEMLSRGGPGRVGGTTVVLVDGDHVGHKLAPQILAHGNVVEVYGRRGAASAWAAFASRNPDLPITVHCADHTRGAADGAIIARVAQLTSSPKDEHPDTVLIISEDKGFDAAIARFMAADFAVRRIAPSTLTGQPSTPLPSCSWLSSLPPSHQKSPPFLAVVDKHLSSGPVPLSMIGAELKALGLRQKHLLKAVRARGYATWLEDGNDSIWWVGPQPSRTSESDRSD